MNYIVMPIFNRPKYLYRVFSQLEKCQEIDNYTLLAQIEPSHEYSEIKKVIKNSSLKIIPKRNEFRQYSNNNTFRVLSRGFKKSNFIIYLEDDIILSRDALLFYEYCAEKYKNDDRIFCITAYNRMWAKLKECQIIDKYKAFNSPTFGLWADRWKFIQPRWPRPWDIKMKKLMKGQKVLYPRLTRAKHIGRWGGLVRKHPNEKNKPWANDIQCAPQWVESRYNVKQESKISH